MFGVLSDSPRIEKYFDLKFVFQSCSKVLIKGFSFDDFQLDFSQHFWAELENWSVANLLIKTRVTAFIFKVLSKTQQICNYKLLNIGDFWVDSEFQFYFVFYCFHLKFSPIYSTQLQNFPKTKLLGFECSKTLLKASRAESC